MVTAWPSSAVGKLKSRTPATVGAPRASTTFLKYSKSPPYRGSEATPSGTKGKRSTRTHEREREERGCVRRSSVAAHTCAGCQYEAPWSGIHAMMEQATTVKMIEPIT